MATWPLPFTESTFVPHLTVCVCVLYSAGNSDLMKVNGELLAQELALVQEEAARGMRLELEPKEGNANAAAPATALVPPPPAKKRARRSLPRSSQTPWSLPG